MSFKVGVGSRGWLLLLSLQRPSVACLLFYVCKRATPRLCKWAPPMLRKASLIKITGHNGHKSRKGDFLGRGVSEGVGAGLEGKGE